MTANAAARTNEPQTLAQRLGQGKIPAPEAERYAMILAEALRRIHDAGQAHGGVSPDSIVLIGSGLELGAAQHTEGTITPYTAPELLEGHPPDSRSDLFAFGAVVYEMFSGRRAFEGEDPAALAKAINTWMPPSCGSFAVDRLVSNCLAKDPAARWQRMHKIQMELKLLTVLERRAGVPVSAGLEPADAASLRAEMQQLESRVAARLQAYERTVAQIQHATTELRGQLAAVNAWLATAGEQQVSVPEAHVKAGGDRMVRLEKGLEAMRKRIATLHESVAEDFLEFEQALKSQAAAIESARTAMAQTDDLVERVVEAVKSLQSGVLAPREDRAVTRN
jgi:hypothetical protein